MIFEKLQFINLFWIIPILIFLIYFSAKARQKALSVFAHPDMLKKISMHVRTNAGKIKAILFLTAIAFLIITLMEPKFGSTKEIVNRIGRDVIVAVDVSKSMLADDIKPSRLERAKRAILDLLNVMEGDRIGLIAFAGAAFLQCPLTLDYGAAKMFINELNPSLISHGGTKISSAILKAISAFEGTEKKYRSLILITDGENLSGEPEEAAKIAKENGITIFCIGIGSPDGHPIQISTQNGESYYLKDNKGEIVISKLDEKTLQNIALITGGAYARAVSSGIELDEIYTKRIKEMDAREIESQHHERMIHRYQWPLAIAVFLIILEYLIRENKKLIPVSTK